MRYIEVSNQNKFELYFSIVYNERTNGIGYN